MYLSLAKHMLSPLWDSGLENQCSAGYCHLKLTNCMNEYCIQGITLIIFVTPATAKKLGILVKVNAGHNSTRVVWLAI